MAQPYNPFGALTTPQTRYEEREANMKAWDSQGFWVGQAARAGSKLRYQLNKAGIAMGVDDEIAMKNEAALTGIQEDLAKEVEAGNMTTEEAQRAAVEQTIKALMANGDYKGVYEMKMVLDEMDAKEQQRQLLRSQVAANEAKAAKDAKEKEEGEAGIYDITKNAKDRIAGRYAGSIGAIGRMGQIVNIISTNPAAMSDAAGAIQTLREKVVGAANTAKYYLGIMEDEDKKESVAIENAYKEEVLANATKVKNRNPHMNVDVAMLRSLTMDLAYQLAKARDPGGRLSDADVKNAMEIIGASGDPVAMKATLMRLVDNTYNDIKILESTLPWAGKSAENADARQALETSYADYKKLLEELNTPAPAATPKPREGVKPSPASPAPAAAGGVTFDENGRGTVMIGDEEVEIYRPPEG